eukprot:scaffold223642_cov41-Prasinocladus_malaysianus.AAC.1
MNLRTNFRKHHEALPAAIRHAGLWQGAIDTYSILISRLRQTLSLDMAKLVETDNLTAGRPSDGLPRQRQQIHNCHIHAVHWLAYLTKKLSAFSNQRKCP